MSRPPKPIESYPPVKPDDLPEAPPEPAVEPATPPAAEPPRPARPQAEPLDFLGPRSVVVTLDHPFTWQGRAITAITVRRLTGADVAGVADGPKSEGIWPFYAAMTGLPAGVLVGLDEDDLSAVLEAARGFLPRVFGGPTAASNS